MIDSNRIVAVRSCARMTQEEAATACGISQDTYRSREKNPGDFRLSEIEAFYKSINEDAGDLLRDACRSIFL